MGAFVNNGKVKREEPQESTSKILISNVSAIHVYNHGILYLTTLLVCWTDQECLCWGKPASFTRFSIIGK